MNYNATEQTATVYTRDKAVVRRFDALKDAFPNAYRLISETDIDKIYEMLKALVNLRKPMRILEAQRVAAGERMRTNEEEYSNDQGVED